MNPFWVVTGPDYAGKSTMLNCLSGEHNWRVVSYDDRYLDRYPLIRQLRREWVDAAFARVGRRYSAELVLSALHPIVLHLRDELYRTDDTDRVVVDSYYYKLLAKCRLLGVRHQPTFDYWRSFPRPRGVVYLDVAPEVAWARSGYGAKLNVFEHHGAAAGRPGSAQAGFARLQSQLRAAILEEIGDVPVTIVDGEAPADAVLAEVLAVLGMAVAR
jgi:thymidylate kinase